MSNIEQTLSIIKPDAVERKLDNEIKEIFKNKGFKIIKEKKIQIEKAEAEKFYKVHETKAFYDDLCSYLSSGPIVVMVLEKENAVLANRELMGSTNPKDAVEEFCGLTHHEIIPLSDRFTPIWAEYFMT